MNPKKAEKNSKKAKKNELAEIKNRLEIQMLKKTSKTHGTLVSPVVVVVGYIDTT